MFDGYRVVAVTPTANRARYLDIVSRYVMRDRHIIDEWRLWVNIHKQTDVGCAQDLARKHTDFITCVEHHDRHIQPFYAECCDPDTIYLKLDDDIVWVDTPAVAELLNCRIQNRDPLVVFSNTINNGICAHFHQKKHAIPSEMGEAPYESGNTIAYNTPAFAGMTHRKFLERLAAGTEHEFIFPDHVMSDYRRYSVNFMAFFGRDIAGTSGVPVGIHDELWWTEVAPKEQQRPNLICGTSLVSHFAFFTQRHWLEVHTDLLSQYERIAATVSC